MYDVIIIGAGVIGGFIARELSKYQVKVLVLEKENDVGNGSSNANSAIIHAGYDPLPNTLKARFNVLGAKMYPQIVKELDVKYNKIGSLVVGKKESDFSIIEELFKRGKDNGVDVEIIEGELLRKLEPHLASSLDIGLYAKDAAIIDPFNLVVHCFENAIDNGVELKLNEEVIGINTLDNNIYEVVTTNNKYKSHIVINASGVNGDKVNEFINEKTFEILPNRGEYYVLDHFSLDFVNHVIFPTPSKKGKGVLVTPTTSHNYLVGPSSDFVDNRYGVSTDKSTLESIKSKAKTIVEDVPYFQTIRVFSGMRPRSNQNDFIIRMEKDGFINVVGIESPGFASAPAIGEYVVSELVGKCIKLERKESFNPYVKKYMIPRDLTLEDRAKLIESDPLYGHIICRCEQVSEGEIRDVLDRSCPPHSIKGIKKRTRAGFGKCQGGICQPLVANFLAKKNGDTLLNILYDSINTPIVSKETKRGVKNSEND